MQISRMPIPADNCSNSEIMSADATNTSDSKSSDVETTTKMNGDSHKKLNGTAVVESSNDTNEINETSEVAVKEGNIKSSEIKEPESNPESSQSVDEPPKNGASSEEEQRECDGNAENTDQVETSLSTTTVDDKPKDSPNKVEEAKPKIDQNQANEVVVIKQENQLNEVVVIKLEPETEVYNPETAVGVEMEKLQNSVHNGEVSHSDEVIKNGEEKSIPVNGRVKVEVDKVIESEKEKNIQKVPEEEDMSSEMSTDALSPKQIDEPVARKRSAASHDELSVVSGASSDNDLPKTKKLRSDEDVPLIKDDTRERLIKNIVHSSGKNEVELSRNIEKIQNEIKVITEIAQTKRDELVTLIRLQKLKEEIIERLMIKVKELDAMKTDNSKDWNLPEMFQINLSRNLSQSEHILNEKNVLDIIDNRDNLIEKSMTTSYEQNNYAAPSSSTSITPVVHHTAMNAHSNDWIMADRANRTNQRVQRVILPKPSAAVNNQKEGRQGPILDVKLIIADHRSKNPETAVPKRGRRKAPVNDFSAPTSSTQMRYPNPMSFNNPIHHANDGNFKTTVTNSHGVPNNVLEHGSDHNRFKDVPAFPEVTLHPVSQPMQQQLQQPTSLLHGILTKGTHHLPLSMSNPPTNYSPTLARLLTAPERCKQPRGKQRQPPAATVVSSNTQSRNEITITPVQSTSMSTTFQPKPSVASNIPSTQQVDDEDASDRLVIDEGQDVVNANSPSSAPQCQGCMQKPAQFVCAGCGNQWYCSKDCQIDAWDDHSEVCSG
ncbi:Hypothetical protein CINCED_3A012068 [Cinara cedri]|uniref:MYND-type domain-containing protein n=1 Tax=Cinara cedri TaxID=506608 RepID=A0A5E4N3H5_9HEMI|nr:Hypothetical protein CINCED_3A012068 [Cinara cedri]